MNTEIEKLAQKVLDNMGCEGEEEYGVDPITIILVISVILTLVRVIQECRKKRVSRADLVEIVNNDSWLNRWRVQRVLKKELSANQYKKYGKRLQQSLKDVAVSLKDEQVTQLMENV